MIDKETINNTKQQNTQERKQVFVKKSNFIQCDDNNKNITLPNKTKKTNCTQLLFDNR